MPPTISVEDAVMEAFNAYNKLKGRSYDDCCNDTVESLMLDVPPLPSGPEARKIAISTKIQDVLLDNGWTLKEKFKRVDPLWEPDKTIKSVVTFIKQNIG